jgi:ribosomal protein S12 methylthiotransferase accessory factor
LSRIDKCGYDVIIVKLTTPEIEEVGFTVVRVIIPGLQPLDVRMDSRYLGGKRLYDVPVSLGYREKVYEENMCPYPHPFP